MTFCLLVCQMCEKYLFANLVTYLTLCTYIGNSAKITTAGSCGDVKSKLLICTNTMFMLNGHV